MKNLAIRTHISLSSRWHALTERTRDEVGQTSVEYLGIVVVVVALIGAIVGLAPSIGTEIANKIKSLVTGLGV